MRTLLPRGARGCWVVACEEPHFDGDYCKEHFEEWLADGQQEDWRPKIRVIPLTPFEIQRIKIDALEKIAEEAKRRARVDELAMKLAEIVSAIQSRRSSVLAQKAQLSRCRILACDCGLKGYGYCSAHYQKWVRLGRPEPWIPDLTESPKLCRLPQCDRKRFAMGLCNSHYEKWREEGRPANWKGGIARVFHETCLVPNCGGPHKAHGYCREHYEAWKRDGCPVPWVPHKLATKKVKACKVPGCPRVHMGRGYCRTHYAAWVYAGSPKGWLPVGTVQLEPMALCKVPECGIEVRARGWCNGHYQRWIKLGKPAECDFLPGPPNRKNVS